MSNTSEFFINRAIWGYEIGAEGTPHLQGYLEFNRSKRLSHVRKILRETFWQEANGNSVANYKYCSKSGCAQILANPFALNHSKYCRYNRLN